MSITPETRIAGSRTQTSTLGSADSDPRDDGRGLRVARRAFMYAWMAALFAVALALAVNWFFAPTAGDPFPGYVGEEPLPLPTDFVPASSSVSLLPARVLSYETITLQAVPGQEDRAAEAIYVTLNMDMEIQRPINTYARVEQFPSAQGASQRVEELMEPYQVDRTEVVVGQTTIASAGFAGDESAYTVAWAEGAVTYLVKTAYRDIPPVQSRRKFLLNVSAPVVNAVAAHVAEN